MTKPITAKLSLLKYTIMGALDGLELDTTSDVIEKSMVIKQLKTELNYVRSIELLLTEKESRIHNESKNPLKDNM